MILYSLPVKLSHIYCSLQMLSANHNCALLMHQLRYSVFMEGMFVFDILQIAGEYRQIFSGCSAPLAPPWLWACCYLDNSLYLHHKIQSIQHAQDRQVPDYQIFWITRQNLYWPQFLPEIPCYCSYSLSLAMSVALQCPPHLYLLPLTFTIVHSISSHHTVHNPTLKPINSLKFLPLSKLLIISNFCGTDKSYVFPLVRSALLTCLWILWSH